MSTEHQKYSTENQSEAIRQFAARRGYQIVQTYCDKGKSGLRLDGRDGLKRLIDDVQSRRAAYKAVLVYDVSRWGRFQDADESAYYEYLCKSAGIRIEYCAEQFENDGSPVSTIVKGVKRAMAGEYSRELSAKVFAGQCRLIELGFRQGGPPGYGLRRNLIDQGGNKKAELRPGEHKSIQTDRVVLVHGPPGEVDTVRWIYRTFLKDGMPETQIANMLNARETPTATGRPWTRGTVHQILTNEKYVGNNVWNRRSFKLKKKRVKNDPEIWVRAVGAFEPIVTGSEFLAVRDIIAKRSERFSDAQMIEILQQVLDVHGRLSALIIDEFETAPSSFSYRKRFGSLTRAYRLVGYSPERDVRYIEINRYLRDLYPKVVEEIVAGVQAIGGAARLLPDGSAILVNEELSTAVVIARSRVTSSGSLRWVIRFERRRETDLTVAVRMDTANQRPLDYFLLPRLDFVEKQLRLAESNGVWLESYRVDTLQSLFDLAARKCIRELAA